MTNLINSLQNNALASLTKGASDTVLDAIQNASTSTGVDFAYLLKQAQVESNFDPDIKAKTSSATGLYQFIKSTWMSMIDKYGDKYGIQTEGMSKQEILDLRKDPEIASNMAAEFASDNERFLNDHWGGEVGPTELYLAHFLGAPNAAAFLNARDENGMKPAALLFPAAAKANKSIFYDTKTGRAKTLDEVYAYFDNKFQIEKIDPKKLVIDNAVQIAEDAKEKSLTSPLEMAETQQEKSYNSLVYKNKTPQYYSPIPHYQMIQSPVELMLLSQLDLPGVSSNSDHENSLFSSLSLQSS